MWRGLRPELKTELTGLVLVAFAILIFFALRMAELYQGTGAESLVGSIGSGLAVATRGLAGRGRYLVPLLIGLAGMKLIYGRQEEAGSLRLLGLTLLAVVVVTLLHVPVIDQYGISVGVIQRGLEGSGGGVVGALGGICLRLLFGRIGTYIVLATLGITSLLLITEGSLFKAGRNLGKSLAGSFQWLKQLLTDFLFVTVEEEVREKESRRRPLTPQPSRAGSVPPKGGSRREEHAGGQVVSLPVAARSGEETSGQWTLPSLDILQRAVKIRSPRLKKDVADNIKILEETLENFGVKAKVSQVSCGPAITRYELQPAPGVKVSRIVSLADDIALSLAADHVRIEAPIPGKAALGIEIPNKEVSTVYLRDVLETEEFQASTSKLAVALGKDITGKPVIADLARMPHLLIAGATGSGKSVCLNGLTTSLLFKCTPADLRVIMIDPKMVELTNYNGIPHLLTPVITDPKKAAASLKWLVGEMERRYELFSRSGVRDITRYNAKVIRDGEEPLPLVVVLIDELADLMMVSPAEVEDAICRLAQMARAAGIHLVVATQRPSVDIITGVIKANIPSRIAFAVSSQTDSRTILDMAGAEKLVGRGDMLFLPVGATKPVRIQGVFVSDREVDDLVTFWKKQGGPEYVPGIGQYEVVPSREKAEEDELLPEALKLVLETGQVSVSMLQRKLRVGYNRAARLIELMEAHGFISSYEGGKRSVMVDWEDYDRLFRRYNVPR